MKWKQKRPKRNIHFNLMFCDNVNDNNKGSAIARDSYMEYIQS